MFTDEPTQYLSAFKEFLLEQQSRKDDPAITALIAEITHELLKRTERGLVH